MEPNGDTPPFWSQSNTTHPLPSRRNRFPPSPLLNPVVLIIAVPILLFFILPPFLSHATQILKPNSVKKGWDYFNVLLVFFAIICGVFARRNDDVSSPNDAAIRPQSSDNVSSFVNEPRHSVTTWLEFPDRKEYNSIVDDSAAAEWGNGGGGGGRLKRNSSSYPDLRQESLRESEDVNTFRFFDDFEVNFNRSPPRDYLHRWGGRIHEAELAALEIPVDTFEVSSASPPQPPTPPKSPPPPPPLPSAEILKQKRSYRSVPRKEEIEKERNEAELSENQEVALPPEPANPQPQPEAEEFQFPEVISEIVPRKKSGATKEFASAIASLYKGQKRKRKKKVKSREIYESAPQNFSPPPSVAPQSVPPTPPPPPPPPPLPPPNVFQNLFKKSSKSKRVVPTTASPPNSIFNNLFTASQSKRFPSSSTPPPPPPPPPSSILNSLFKNGGNNRRFKEVNTTPPPPPQPAEPPRRRESRSGKPPKPPSRSTEYIETPIVAPPSPFIPMPPPPPPFKISKAMFIAQGDFVRIQSADSSRCNSPELEDYDVMSVKSESEESSRPSITCPSPDVNTKADNFIARLRDEWKMEKMNSMKERRTLG